jgi:hypothetical protein
VFRRHLAVVSLRLLGTLGTTYLDWPA